ncbi:ABC transporter permease subunit [candidate division KSB3 bacterium]|uniref:ABC transporter permease subunit n=1 Tax=candidate division KSB3 bacterium TaxID=2044937 RepID=A0A9D5JT00_9BACT|nr:ABC transporter permease subunit [candidate division KSB3 bacterium]MBD3323066.1 ABC transporter permease subunit [candidate division KSB3 bacterium]
MQKAAVLRRFTKNPIIPIGTMIIILMILVGSLAPYLSPYDPSKMSPRDRREAPSKQFWLGTDRLGRDMLSRMIWGARVSLVIGVLAVAVSLVVGLTIGLMSGYYGGMLDEVLMRLMDIIFAFPSLLLAIALIAVTGPSMRNIIFVVAVIRVPRFARIIRGSVLSLKEKEFVEAARALSKTDLGIMFQHILPNCIAPLTVEASLSIATAIITESALSFLGLGVRPPTPSWGQMIADGRSELFTAPWIVIFPGLAIMITVLGYNLLGDGLRDALDPRLRQ